MQTPKMLRSTHPAARSQATAWRLPAYIAALRRDAGPAEDELRRGAAWNDFADGAAWGGSSGRLGGGTGVPVALVDMLVDEFVAKQVRHVVFDVVFACCC